MLKKPAKKSAATSQPGHFAIVASQYNQRYVDALLRYARAELKAASVSSIQVVRVPGAFEIPVVASALARNHLPRLSAILCFGVVFQGETTHAQHISDAVSHALAKLQVDSLIPVIHGVYHFQNEEQARVRCLSKTHSRGIEIARTALSMANVMQSL